MSVAPITIEVSGAATGSPRARRPAAWFERHGRWLIILPPVLFLVVFFIIPFGFAPKISFAEALVAIPAFSKVLSVSPDDHVVLTLSLANYRYLFTDDLYVVSYLYSLRTAFFSTLVCLVVGYPMAYAIARAPRTTQQI